MKVFISWSGERSKYVAQTLRSWLPKVIQAVEPWMSQEDISSGTRWSTEIAQELASSSVGIICITPENQKNPWIMFEAGALSKTIQETFVCPYLYELSPSDLAGPIAQFQSNQSTKEGTSKILTTLNKSLGSSALENNQLNEIFDVWWPKLEEKLKTVPLYSGERASKRTTEELLEEVINNTREQLRREEIRLQRSIVMEDKLIKFEGLFENMVGSASEYQKVLKHLNSISVSNPSVLDGLKSIIPSENSLQSMMSNFKEMRGLDKEFTSKLLKPTPTNDNGDSCS